MLDGARFDLRDAQKLERNPMTYLSPLSLTPYLAREYAPAPARVEAIVHLLEGVPRTLDIARQRLVGPLPQPFVELALAIGGGLSGHFWDAEKFATAAGVGAPVTPVRERADTAVSTFLAWLKETELPRAVPEFALGAERFQRLLFVREGIEAPYADLERAGMADLARNQARLEEVARGEHLPVSALLSHVQHDHPSAEALLDTARGYVEECRRFVEEQALASIPGPVACRVEETPVRGRATTTASLDPPGPFDAQTAEGIYYVTLVDPSWTPEQQLEWLRTMNRPMLRNTAVHEVYPGHYLQALHFRANAGSLTRKIYQSPSVRRRLGALLRTARHRSRPRNVRRRGRGHPAVGRPPARLPAARVDPNAHPGVVGRARHHAVRERRVSRPPPGRTGGDPGHVRSRVLLLHPRQARDPRRAPPSPRFAVRREPARVP